MDANQTVAELTETSPQIELVVVFDDRGRPVADTLPNRSAAKSLAAKAGELFASADRIGGEEHGPPTQIELSFANGSLLLVREGNLRALAVTSPDPIVGLALFDLMICLRKTAGVETRTSWRRLFKLRPGATDDLPANDRGGKGGRS